MAYTHIIFDLDGTLLDTLGDLTDAVNAALSARGCPLRTQDEVRSFIGNGIRNLMEQSLPAGSTDIDGCLADFRRHYEAHMMRRTAPYPGIPALLKDLRARKITLAVLSNKYDPAAKALAAHYFPGLFACVLGEQAGVPRKPDPAGVFALLDGMGALPAHTLYVGDSGTDMRTAAAAGLTSVGVTWGFRSRASLKEAGAHHLIDHPSMLLRLL